MATSLSEQTARDLNKSLATLSQRIKELEADIERLVRVNTEIAKHLRATEGDEDDDAS